MKMFLVRLRNSFDIEIGASRLSIHFLRLSPSAGLSNHAILWTLISRSIVRRFGLLPPSFLYTLDDSGYRDSPGSFAARSPTFAPGLSPVGVILRRNYCERAPGGALTSAYYPVLHT